MSEDTRRVLDLLAQGKITVDEAHQLLEALRQQGKEDGSTENAADPAQPRYLRINVHKTGRDGHRDKDVNIRVPISVIRGGMRLGTIIPGLNEHMTAKLRQSGVDIDLTRMDARTIETMLKDLGQVNIDVNEGDKQVRITCE